MRRLPIIGLVAVLAACATPSPAPRVSLPAPYTDQGINVVVEGLWENGHGNVQGVNGLVTNLSDRDLTLCQVTFDLLDVEGTKVSSAIAATSGLKVGQKWRFQAPLTSPYTVQFSAIVPGQTTVSPPPTLQAATSSQTSQQQQAPPQPQNQAASNPLKTSVEQIIKEQNEVCAREEYKPLFLHTWCEPKDTGFEHFVDRSKLSESDKPLFLKFQSEWGRLLLRSEAAARAYGGSKGKDLAAAFARGESLALKNRLNLYEGKITWGEYNKRRKKITDMFRRDYDRINR